MKMVDKSFMIAVILVLLDGSDVRCNNVSVMGSQPVNTPADNQGGTFIPDGMNTSQASIAPSSDTPAENQGGTFIPDGMNPSQVSIAPSSNTPAENQGGTFTPDGMNTSQVSSAPSSNTPAESQGGLPTATFGDTTIETETLTTTYRTTNISITSSENEQKTTSGARTRSTTKRSSSTSPPTPAATQGSSTLKPPGHLDTKLLVIGFLIIVLLSVVLAVLLFMIFRSKKCPNPFVACVNPGSAENSAMQLKATTGRAPKPPDLTLDLEKTPNKKKTAQEETIGDQSKVLTSKIPLEDLQKHIRSLMTHHMSGFKKEYSHISRRYEKPKVAEHSSLVTKNKFRDILPYDSTRVVLNTLDNEPHSHYINASWVKGYETEDIFIACQGPWYTTLEDFWRMIWEYNAALIVMVTQYVEKGVRKVEQYIPERVNRSETHGDVCVKLVKEDIRADFTTRVLHVSSGDTQRVVRQFHFTAWPDHGVPSHGASLANFHRQVKQQMAPGQPVVVHCSAGVGRTGTYIALDQLLQQGERTGNVDVLGCVQHLRKHRSHMVQTTIQYVFLYETILEAFAVGNTTIACSKYANEYKRLKRYSRVSTKPRIRSQFELIQVMSDETDKDDFSQALKKENRKKIKDSSNIPSNNKRVILKTLPKDGSDFINAVFVDGYKKNDAFIATPRPSEETLHDFWVMIKDFDCGSIVLLDTEPIASLLPSKETETVFDKVSAQLSLSVADKGFFVHDMRVERVRAEEDEMEKNVDGEPLEANVRVFEVKLEGEILDFDIMVEVYQGVQKWQQKNDQRPVVVVCPDGAKYCGKFIAVNCLFDMINATQEFDVFYITKLIRMSCKHFIPTMADYEELYDIIGKYIESFSDYSNFK